MKAYDVTIIGSGPGGYVAAIRAAQLGMSVLLVEKDSPLGGVCTLRGCIPTKALLHTADVLDEARHGSSIGVTVGEVSLDWKATMSFKSKVVQQSANGVAFLMKKNKVDVANGFGSLVTPEKVRVVGAGGQETLYTTKNVLIATGSAPRSIPGVEIDGERIISSDHVLELQSIPKSMIILGAGAVGVEFASAYTRFGTQCTVVEALPRLLPIEDDEISAELARAFRRQQIAVHTGAKVERVVKTESGVEVGVRMEDGQTQTLQASLLLVAVGRRPLSTGIGLEACGVATDRGYITVDRFMRTNVPNIYAIGDVVPTPALAHVASAEGTIAVETMAGRETEALNYDKVPWGTYCSPEVASIGLSERKAKERGIDVRVGKFPLSAVGKARILNQIHGFVKIVTDAKYGEVLGIHMIGARVTEMLGEASASLRLETTSEELVRTVHAHPTLSEAIHEAAEVVEGHPIHI